MNTGYYTRDELAEAAKLRPPGYLEELMRAAVAEDADRVTFDKDNPVYVELKKRYAGQPTIEVWREEEIVVDPNTLEPLTITSDPAEWGPPKWEQLHRFTLTDDARDPVKLAAFVEGWRRSIPPLGCSCRADLNAYLKDHPPDAADPFGWGFGLHDVVNAKLKKKQWTMEEARAAWATPQPDRIL